MYGNMFIIFKIRFPVFSFFLVFTTQHLQICHFHANAASPGRLYLTLFVLLELR